MRKANRLPENCENRGRTEPDDQRLPTTAEKYPDAELNAERRTYPQDGDQVTKQLANAKTTMVDSVFFYFRAAHA